MHLASWRALGLALASCLVLTGCKKEPATPTPPAPVTASADAGARPAEMQALDGDPGPKACAAPLTDAPAEPVKLGRLEAMRAGPRLTITSPDADGRLVLGVLGPINEDSNENLANLERFVAFFKEQKADAIVVSGDAGEVAAGITRVLNTLAESGLPVLTTIGNRECEADYVEGVSAAKAAHANVIDLVKVRWIEFAAGALVSLPGYHDPNFINCTTGCRYSKQNLDEVVTLAKAAKKPVILVSHGPPKGQGTQAIDYATSSSPGNVGDPEINRALGEGKIAFGIFSNIKEAGGRATDASFNTPIPPGSPSKALYLNPGPADATNWTMNDRTRSHGMAAVLSIEGDQGTWTAYRAPDPDADDADGKAKRTK